MESVLLYSRQEYASIAPDFKRLRAYQKIDLKAGEMKTVSFKITPRNLAFVNDLSKTVTEPGEFKIMIGDQTANFNFISTMVPDRQGKL